MDQMSILDSHVHVWRLSRGDYDWLTPDLEEIYRDFFLDDIWSTASSAGVSKVILVQAAATTDETNFLLRLSEQDNRIAGVTGWVDFTSQDAPEHVAALAKSPKLVGLRPMIGDIEDTNWILNPSFSPVFEAMSETGLVFEAHARDDHIPVISVLSQRFPSLKLVLGHAGKPQIRSGVAASWYANISELSERPNVFCKFSGLLTEAGDDHTDQSLSPIVNHLIECFGDQRLIWGSDWPVLTLASDYQTWLTQSQRLLSAVSSLGIDQIFGLNARRIYSIEED